MSGVAKLAVQKWDRKEIVVKEVDLGLALEDEESEAHEAHAEASKEVEVLKKLSHPCVIAIYGAFVERSVLFILMEYADGALPPCPPPSPWDHFDASPELLCVFLDLMILMMTTRMV